MCYRKYNVNFLLSHRNLSINRIYICIKKYSLNSIIILFKAINHEH